LGIFGSLREEDDEDNEFSGLLTKVMKGVEEDGEFYEFDDECDEF